jgi:hypothetical protein
MPYRKPPVSPTHPHTMVPSHGGGRRGGMPFHSSSTSGCDQLQYFVESYQKADANPFTDQDSDAEIVEYNDNDVLSGRGKSNLKHPGNQKYQGENEELFFWPAVFIVACCARCWGSFVLKQLFPPPPPFILQI